LRQIIGERRLALIALLNALEHLSNPGAGAARRSSVSMEHGAFVLVSAPNVTHRDISLKLAIGR
jgi:hypothetical protein